MNELAAIELAFAAVIREYAELGAGAWVRSWQTPADDTRFIEGNDRQFPVVRVQCQGSDQDGSAQAIFITRVTIVCATDSDDDPDRQGLRILYSGARLVCDALFRQARSGTDGDEMTRWGVALSDALGATDSAQFHFGGFTFTGGDSGEDGKIQFLSIGMNVHYSRLDFT